MTAAELICKLQQMEPHMQVRFAYDYGDRPHTQVTDPVVSVVEEPCVWSEYHNNYRLIDNYEDTSELTAETFVILFSREV